MEDGILLLLSRYIRDEIALLNERVDSYALEVCIWNNLRSQMLDFDLAFEVAMF